MYCNHRTVLLNIVFLACSCLAIIPSVHNRVPHPDTIHNGESGHLSLPNLLHVSSLDDLDYNWRTLGNPVYDIGRLIFKDKSSIWSLAGLENTQSEWTIELVFRSSGQSSEEAQDRNDNGLAFWLINPSRSSPIDEQNMNNFGGPSLFDGFQFLFNNKDTNGLKIFSSDGTDIIPNSIDNTIGNCAFNYLDSQVPFTIRISYSKEKKWFKVQIDNNVCFKTDQIQVPSDIGDFSFGVSSYTSTRSDEVYELLALKVWPTLIDDSIDDHGIISNGHIRVHYTTVVEDSKPTSYVKPEFVRESLMAKTQRHRDELERQMKEAQTSATSSSGNLEIQLKDTLSSIERLGNAMANFENTNDYNTKHILSQLDDVYKANLKHKEELELLQTSLNDFKSTISQQYSQMLAAFSRLNEKVIGEVREQQFGFDGLASKVDLLMSHHKEIAYQYQQGNANGDKDTITKMVFDAIVKLFTFSFYVGVVFLLIVYRERRHKQHSKLL